tara:strand:- start:406 stop:585 length:180 start_codon:yes stop_codon:yes gene_type:complete
MKVGDLVKAKTLMDHDKDAIGVIIKYNPRFPGSATIYWSNGEGTRNVFTHLIEVLNESR